MTDRPNPNGEAVIENEIPSTSKATQATNSLADHDLVSIQRLDESNLSIPSSRFYTREVTPTDEILHQPSWSKNQLTPVEILKPLPTAAPRKDKISKRKRKSAILIDTPVKDELEKEKIAKIEKENKKNKKVESVKNNVLAEQKPNRDKTKKDKKLKVLKFRNSYSGSEDEESLCLVCVELFSKNLPGERWIEIDVGNSGHTKNGGPFYVCHNCNSDDSN